MTHPAPKPENFDALARAWNDPTAYAAELARYYDQLREAGHTPTPRDISQPLHDREGKHHA
jgi:hypothetical protein